MLLVFIDESGKPTTKEKEPYVVAAFMIRDTDFLDISLALDRIVEDTVAKILGLDPREIEIHTRSIVQNMGIYKGIPPQIRAELLNKVVDFINGLESRAWIAVEIGLKHGRSPPEKEARKRGVRAVYSSLLRDLAQFFTRFGKEMVLIIVDSSELDRDIQSVMSETVREELWNLGMLHRMLVDKPLFLSSRYYRPLQIADVIAYTYRRIAMEKPIAMGGLFNFRNYVAKMDKLLIRKPRKVLLW